MELDDVAWVAWDVVAWLEMPMGLGCHAEGSDLWVGTANSLFP